MERISPLAVERLVPEGREQIFQPAALNRTSQRIEAQVSR
jgi:hypothetical protein